MIDVDAVLEAIPGENPAGEELRYAGVYDEIKEARRADDALDQGDWQRELKTSDWDQVIKLSVEALTEKTKDLQIAAWLAEALIRTEGFDGFIDGFKIVNGLLTRFWDGLYPEIEDGDTDFRAAPLEFANNTLGFMIRSIPLTDPRATSGYSWLKWQESRSVGYEEHAKDPQARKELIAEGKISAEVFDSAVERSTKAFYAGLAEKIEKALALFTALDAVVDEKFGADAPLISDIGNALKDCDRLVSGILKEKRASEPDEAPDETPAEAPEDRTAESDRGEPGVAPRNEPPSGMSHESLPAAGSVAVPVFSVNRLSDSGALEEAVWQDALGQLKSSGLKKALEQLMGAAYTATSPRQKSRYRLLMARLCLKADRPDLARPLIEELNSLLEELNLVRWESPIWIAEVLDTLRQCIVTVEPDSDRAYELLKRICTLDVTKALR